MTARGLSKNLIVKEAMGIAEKDGATAVTMATLAKRLAIKPPSLYNHFKSLDEIKKAVAIAALYEFLHWLEEKMVSNVSGKEAIHALSKAYVAFAQEHPGKYDCSFLAPNPLDQEVQTAGEGIVQLTMKTLSDFPLDDVEKVHIVRGLRSLLHGLVDLDRKGGFQLSVNLEESREVIVETYVRGLEKFDL
ncbi:TetR/AcrR family transcriptional regulator [Guptibacillus hwajinpoensis]|uniref:AcrR family transcriptional regulator n=1 Tax=Guptibacillus hwajinpoensis TaxID=208199 RepID=A0ABU0K382_9BACL|nr:TetR/AcrR family transcriptional regulator [Alkalihalobacillus hemicentroti]MDQ0483814.1 AcrR family transcriptional regulator [Alkalihalobacillus hemicentroti]